MSTAFKDPDGNKPKILALWGYPWILILCSFFLCSILVYLISLSFLPLLCMYFGHQNKLNQSMIHAWAAIQKWHPQKKDRNKGGYVLFKLLEMRLVSYPPMEQQLVFTC